MVLAFIAAYIVLQLVIGGVVSRRIRNEEDYLVAGRSLGPALATASMFATWFGAETCVGAAGEVYAQGFEGVAADPFGYGLCLVAFGLLLARRLWNAQVTTVADLFRVRFSPGVERMVALLMVPGSLFWAAAQLRAFGTVLASATDLVDVEQGLFIAALVTVAYTSLGGLLADAYTDLLQGGILVVGLAVLSAVALSSPSQVSSLMDALSAGSNSPEAGGTQAGLLLRAEAWAVPILGSLFAQELAARAAGARSASLARRSAVGAGAIYIAVGMMPVALGLLARSELAGLEHPEMALPLMAERYLGTVGQGVLAGALVSAILSTIDSALLASSALLTHNLLPAVSAEPSEKAKLQTARLGVLGLGAVAWLLALGAKSVHDLVEEASAFGSAGFVVAGLGLPFVRRGGARAAYLTLGGGVTGYVLFRHAIPLETPFLASLAVAAACWLIGVLVVERAQSR